MSKLYFDFKYRDAQIIKHALQYYLTRDDVSTEEAKQEQVVLDKVEEEINIFKHKNGIK